MSSLTATTQPKLGKTKVGKIKVGKIKEYGVTSALSTWSRAELHRIEIDRQFTAIKKNKEVCGGEPGVAETRVTVRTLFSLHSQGESDKKLAVAFKLEEWQVKAALEYAERNKEEIEKLIKENAEA